MKVRLTAQHPLKAAEFYAKNKDLVFEVIQRRHNGFDVDLAPIVGRPGERGWMHDEEVEILRTPAEWHELINLEHHGRQVPDPAFLLSDPNYGSKVNPTRWDEPMSREEFLQKNFLVNISNQ